MLPSGPVLAEPIFAGYYRASSKPFRVTIRAASAASAVRSSTPERWYVCATIFERLAQDLQDVAAALRPFIQEEDAVVSQRHLARHRHVFPADQSHVRDGVMGGATRASRHQRGAVAREAGDTMDAGGLDGFGQGHCRQDGGESPGQHRLASPRGAEQEHIMGRTPASHFASPMPLGMPIAPLLNLPAKLPNPYGAVS